MLQFEKSQWAISDFSQNYRDAADNFLPFRSQFIETTIFFYTHFVSKNRKAKILDLGCGDGFFIQLLLKSFNPAEIILVDGSQEMLDAAKERLKNQTSVRFIAISFQELLTSDPFDTHFDFIHSSLAIHHISLQQKKKLYAYIYNHLIPNGHFINYDIVISPTEKLEKCYLALWKRWIKTQPIQENLDTLLQIPGLYKTNPDNKPDALEAQLNILKKSGFKNVDCYLKYGLFALFGGSK